ncbi:protein artemis-like [Amphibalanus amphitrite]|uniref:protein artemis-like n=1 Tax=Amphibalanus amphitrite TaxID=1232801 RepID=UPI001C90B1BD|nr:protein artemis-like [Amphibalanus amphitrite]XP_043212034.1 protein artemis-like [Amphibalanus amphitrite]XP_043212035.1 protein artemis-like [Amphibalanus amphitrite]XP_043212036.1 protein artemis-like [Amphibalanus amphitrite]XP_043212038.1 protein artemis-like [Amphibalanus amphitrite]
MPERECFGGLLTGYPEVAVDRFDGRCLNASYFLLSHLHSDHMRGLDSAELRSVLQSQPQPRLLLSRQSAALLASWPRYAALAPHLCPLEVGVPRQLTDRLVVTALPAAHCPGSVMFLLEGGAGGTVLYTGDFRLDSHQLADMKALHDADGHPKPIQALYVDTTFCVPQRRELPTRSRSAESVLRLVTEWLDRAPDNRVNLDCKARYGYEHIFRRLHEATGMRVHVDAEKIQLYERLPDIARCVTSCASETRLHSCRPGSTCLRDGSGGPLRSITLSTMFFFMNQAVDCLEYHLGGERYRVLYSFHASLGQVREMVSYLRPARVVPCVVPPNSSLESVVTLLGGASEPRLELQSSRLLTAQTTHWERRPSEVLQPHRQHTGRRQPPKEIKRIRPKVESPGRRQGHQRSPQPAVGALEERAGAADTRPAWKSPFDSD